MPRKKKSKDYVSLGGSHAPIGSQYLTKIKRSGKPKYKRIKKKKG